jgi:hypothetical protein
MKTGKRKETRARTQSVFTDPTSTLSDSLTGDRAVTAERSNDKRSIAEHAEHALLSALRTATAVNDAIRDIAAAVPKAGAPIPKDAPLPMLLTQPEGIARLMMASNAGISLTIEGMRQIPAMRAEQAVAVRGTQTVYLPGECPAQRKSWEAFDANLERIRGKPSTPTMTEKYLPLSPCTCSDPAHCPFTIRPGEDYPLRESMEAYDEELRQIRAGKYDRVEQIGGGAQGGMAREYLATGDEMKEEAS